MKNLFFSLIFVLFVFGQQAQAQTTYVPADFLRDVGDIVKTEQGPPTTSGEVDTRTTYENGTIMSLLSNFPNPPVITWILPDGSRYTSISGSTTEFRKTREADPVVSPPPLTTQQPSTPRSSGNILDQIVPPNTFESDGALNTIFNQLFWAGLVIAVILAVVMIVAGGIQYMTTDAISGKEDGKDKIRAALGGLLLAFSTVVILNTINPSITEIKLGFQPLQQVEVGVTGLTPLSLEELSITSGDRDLYEEAYNQMFVGPPNITQGTNTNGPIPTSYFGGPADVRTKDGFALHYCNRLMQYARVGSYAESTFIGGSEYRWCYAVDSGGNKIPYTQGRASAHGGYYEPTSFSTNPNQLMRNLSGDYIAYPLNNSGALAMMGLPNRTNTQLRGKSVLLTLQNGQTLTAAVMDRGPHGSIRKLDVSPALSLKISAGGGLTSVRLIE